MPQLSTMNRAEGQEPRRPRLLQGCRIQRQPSKQTRAALSLSTIRVRSCMSYLISIRIRFLDTVFDTVVTSPHRLRKFGQNGVQGSEAQVSLSLHPPTGYGGPNEECSMNITHKESVPYFSLRFLHPEASMDRQLCIISVPFLRFVPSCWYFLSYFVHSGGFFA